MHLEESQEKFRQNIGNRARKTLAAELGVSVESLDALGVGFTDEAAPAFTFPMRNADGQIVGFRLRFYDNPHAKGCLAGGHLGLFVPSGVTPGNCKVICEGESDTAAALTLGMKAIGVPGAGAATEEAVRFFTKSAVSCPCVIQDNDDTGRTGADTLRDGLLAGQIPCKRLAPPEGVKDMCDWFKADLGAADLREAIGRAETCYPLKWPAGFHMVPHAAPRRGMVREIGTGPLALAIVIGSFLGRDGSGFADRETLAKLCGVSTSQIDRWKGVLADAGVLTWEKGHQGKPNVYRVNFGPLPRKPSRK